MHRHRPLIRHYDAVPSDVGAQFALAIPRSLRRFIDDVVDVD